MKQKRSKNAQSSEVVRIPLEILAEVEGKRRKRGKRKEARRKGRLRGEKEAEGERDTLLLSLFFIFTSIVFFSPPLQMHSKSRLCGCSVAYEFLPIDFYSVKRI